MIPINYKFSGKNIVLNFKRKIVYDFDRVKELRREGSCCRVATLEERKKFLELTQDGRDRLSFADFGFRYKLADLWEHKRGVKLEMYISSVTIEMLNHIADILSLNDYENIIEHAAWSCLSDLLAGESDIEKAKKRLSNKYKTDLSLLKTQIETILKFL